MTVLFADMVGSTTLTVSNDAEVVRERLALLFDRAREVLEGHGATVEKFIGDAVMAVFGVPRAHEDDAERAVRAAHALLAAFAAHAEGPIQRVELRVGINTGEVATGGGGGDQLLATGQAVNFASRLQSAAAPGEILIGPLTRRLVAPTVRIGPVRRVAAKGLGDIEAWPVEGLISPVPTGSHPLPADSRFVGRERELALLGSLAEHAASSGRPYLVTITGDAGIGKSRLVDEFVASLQGALVIATRCPPYGEGLALWPIEQVVGPTPAATPQHQVVEDFRRHLEVLAHDGLVVLVVEDLHWAETAFLDAVEEIVDRARGAIFVLCTARPELFTSRPGWGGGRPTAASVAVGPLADDAVERLVASVDAKPISAGAIASVVAHGEGNPLFIQEYVRALREDDRSALGGAVPPTLRALIAARLDRVPAETRRLLLLASVIGRTFGLEALGALGVDAGKATGLLDDAERLELVRSLDPPGITDRRFTFAHVLYRDVAYAGLPKAARSEEHDHLSRLMESRPSEIGVAAHHGEQAFLLATELGSRSATALGVRAFDLLRRAAEDRRARTDSHAALSFYRRALQVAAAAGVSEHEALEMRARAVIARLRIDGSAEAVAELDEILSAARTEAPSGLLVQLLAWRYSISLLDDAQMAAQLIQEAIAVAERAGDTTRVAYARWASAELYAAGGDLAGQRRTLESARAQMSSIGSTYWLVPCLVDLADNALQRGDGAEAERFAKDALLASESGVSAINRFRSLEVASRARLSAGDIAEAGRYADAATVLARDIGEPWASARAALASAAYRRALGDLDGAGRMLEAALKDAEQAARPTMRGVLTELRAALATVRAERGDRAGAAALLASARTDAPRADARARAYIATAARAIEDMAAGGTVRA